MTFWKWAIGSAGIEGREAKSYLSITGWPRLAIGHKVDATLRFGILATRTSGFDDPGAWRTQGEFKTAMEKVGLTGMQTEEVKMPFKLKIAEALAEFWFQAKNPAPMKVMAHWPQEIMEQVRGMVCRVVRQECADAKGIYTWAVSGVGKKPANVAEVRS